jgi:hypothetical protein
MLPDIRSFTVGVTVVLAAGAVSTAGLVRAGFALSGRDICEHRILAAVPSPDERLSAVVYRPQCAAGLGRPTGRVVRAGAPGASSGREEVFEADVSALPGELAGALDLEWVANDRLRVAYDPSLRVLRRMALSDGVQVWSVPRESGGRRRSGDLRHSAASPAPAP